MDKKIKVLAYCDSPTCATGFGTVARNVFEALYNTGRYDIDIFGINYWGDPHNFPYRIWPAGTNVEKDPYGRQKAINMIPNMDFDILFFLQDTFIMDFLPTLLPHLKTNRKKPFKSICYYPTDSIIKQKWAESISYVDYIVSYTEFGKQSVLKSLPDRNDIVVIPHGVNINDFFPIRDKNKLMEFKSSYFGKYADWFIITNLNRNQQRKDIPRTIRAFKKFRESVPESILYLHMAQVDQGWNLPEVCNLEGLSISSDVIFPQNFGPNQGYPKEIVNALYNCSDVVVSTTLGEGFGLCLHPDTCVYTEDGIKIIKDINIADKVLSSDGSYNDVEAVMYRQYAGIMYEITTRLSNIPIKSSPDHGFKILENNEYVWKKAEHLKEGDVLLFPKNYVANSTEKINILDLIIPSLYFGQIKNIVKKDNKFIIQQKPSEEAVFIPEKINVTKSLMRLFGLYLAGGSVDTPKIDSITFSFDRNEQCLLDFIETEMKNVFGLDRHGVDTYFIGKDCDRKSIVFYSFPVARLFSVLFGSKDKDKKIPQVFLDQPKELLKELIQGEFLGNSNVERNQLVFFTISRDMAYGIRIALAKIGVLASVHIILNGYKIVISGVSKDKCLKMFGMPYSNVGVESTVEYCSQTADYLLLPIKKIGKNFYEGKLVDIQVANTNDFVAENVVVHNSWIEAMATKTPILMPRNTAMEEFITEDRGYLMNSGNTDSLWTVLPHDNEVQRPLVDVDDMVEKLLHIYNNRDEANKKAEFAYDWVVDELDWQGPIAKQWVELFDNSYKEAQKTEEVSFKQTDSESVIDAEEF